MSPALKQFFRDFLVISLIGGLVGLVFFSNPVKVYESGGWERIWAYIWRGGVGTAVLWLGNAHLSNLPDRWFSWIDAPLRRLALSVGITVVFTCLAWVLLVWLLGMSRYGFDLFALLEHLDFEDFVTPLIITFLISIFMHGRAFLLGWREALVEAERLKKEQISARYEALKNQVNPHFLFNSLNVLASLVHRDADKAELFIRRLSDVYRYILESRDRELVPLTEELEILRAYLFLMDTRFGAALRVEYRLPEPAEGWVAPLSLQMLAENALKHNEVSKARPLNLEIFAENGFVAVRNNLQPKTSLPESTGIGLANIQARYQTLAGKDVLIRNDDGHFTVKIPVLRQPQPEPSPS